MSALLQVPNQQRVVEGHTSHELVAGNKGSRYANEFKHTVTENSVL